MWDSHLLIFSSIPCQPGRSSECIPEWAEQVTVSCFVAAWSPAEHINPNNYLTCGEPVLSMQTGVLGYGVAARTAGQAGAEPLAWG